MEGTEKVYCLIPPVLAPQLLDPLQAHFEDDPLVEVRVDRRGGGRRDLERGERRAAATPATGYELPAWARAYEEAITFVSVPSQR